jgi:hypothetical protein
MSFEIFTERLKAAGTAGVPGDGRVGLRKEVSTVIGGGQG